MSEPPEVRVQQLARPPKAAFIAWFPVDDFARVCTRWPAIAAEYAELDYPAYLRGIEALSRHLCEGGTDVALVVVDVDQYASWCMRHQLDPADPETRARYALDDANEQHRTPWPPGDDEACWCNSSSTYRTCCGGQVLYDRPLTQRDLPKLLQQYIGASSWIERRCLLGDHSELLGDAATRVIRRNIETLQREGRRQDAAGLEALIASFALARQEGVDAMFAGGLLRSIAGDECRPTESICAVTAEVSRAAYPMWRQATAEAHARYTSALECLAAELREAAWPQEAQCRARRMLCTAYTQSFPVTRQVADLDAAIAVSASIAEELPDDVACRRAEQLRELGVLCAGRIQAAPDATVFERGIAALTKALGVAPDDWEALPACSSTLAWMYQRRYERWGSHRDLDLAIDSYLTAATSTDARDDPNSHAICVNSYTLALRERFLQRPDLTDLDDAVHALTVALRAASLNPENMHGLEITLGLLLQLRYDTLGSTVDLDRAAELYQRVLQADPPHVARHRAYALNNLGMALLARHRRLNQPSDLDRAIDLLAQGVDESPADSPVRWERIHNLASALTQRAVSMHNPVDVEGALAATDDAVACTPGDPRKTTVQLAWRAILLVERGRADDYQSVAILGERVLGALPLTQAERPRLIDVLVRALTAQHALPDAADLERALELSEYAVRVPVTQVDYLPARLATLASVLQARYTHYQWPADLNRAVAIYRQIMANLEKGDVRARLDAAQAWTAWALHRQAVGELREAAHAVRRAAVRLAVIALATDVNGRSVNGRSNGISWWHLELPANADHLAETVLRHAQKLFSTPARMEAIAALNDTCDHEVMSRFRRSVTRMHALDRSSLDQLPSGHNIQDHAKALRRGWEELRATTSAASTALSWRSCDLLNTWSDLAQTLGD